MSVILHAIAGKRQRVLRHRTMIFDVCDLIERAMEALRGAAATRRRRIGAMLPA